MRPRQALTGGAKAGDCLLIMDALLAIGGEGPSREVLAPRFPSFGIICAADSGLSLLHAWNLAPDLIVGDFDSLEPPELLDAYAAQGKEILRFPRAKDESDTELALRILRERGADRVAIAGGGGGRIDHLLAIRALFEREESPLEWHTADDGIFLVREGETYDFEAEAGGLVSVFPLAQGASGMESEGLVWPLHGLVWGAGDFGLSNEARGGRVRIRAGKGSLLVVRRHDGRTQLPPSRG